MENVQDWVSLIAGVLGIVAVVMGGYNIQTMYKVRKEFPELAKIPQLVADQGRLERALERLEGALDVREKGIMDEFKAVAFAARTQYQDELTNLTRSYQMQTEKYERQLSDSNRQCMDGFAEMRRMFDTLSSRIDKNNEEAARDRSTAAMFQQAVEQKFEKEAMQRTIDELQAKLDVRTGAREREAEKRGVAKTSRRGRSA